MIRSTLISPIRALPTGVIVAVVLAILVALLWLPFGLNGGYTGDAWILFPQADEGVLMASASPLRILLPVPWLISYALSPGSFAGINLFAALLIFGKGCLCYALLRRLNSPAVLAFAVAVLAVLLPADTGIFYLGALAIHFSLFCFLLALYLLLVYWQTRRPSALLGMMFAQLFCLAVYELVYPLVCFAPLMLLYRKPKFNRRFFSVSLLWYLVPLLYGLWYLWLALSFPRAFRYQTSLMARPSIPEILESVLNIYRRHFVDSWLQGFALPNHLLIAAIAGALVFAVCIWLWRREPLALQPRAWLLLIVGGVAIIALGVALYLPTALRSETQRTFYFSSLAALVLGAVLGWVTRRPWIFAVFVAVFAGVGMLRLLDQHAQYMHLSARQQALFAGLARALPAVTAGSGIVVVDETPNQDIEKLLYDAIYMEYVPPMLYQDYSLQSALCTPEEFGVDEGSRCRFTPEGLTVPSTRTWLFDRPYAQTIFLRYDGAFTIIDDLAPYTGAPVPGYQPEPLYDPAAPLPARVATLFAG